jgi:hypothetical protein
MITLYPHIFIVRPLRPGFLFYLGVAALLCLVSPARAQVHVEEEVTSDSIDVFADRNAPEKSSALSMTANLLLPGLGQCSMGKQNSALGYFCVEALFVFGAFACNQYSKDIAGSAHAYAFTNANVKGGSYANDYFWENVGKTMDSDGLNQSKALGYNQVMDLNRASDNDKYLKPELQWRWNDESTRQQYNSIMKKSLRYKVASNFFLGAMLVNRIVAFVDTRVASRNSGRGLFSSFQLAPHYNPQTGESGLVCSSSF